MQWAGDAQRFAEILKRAVEPLLWEDSQLTLEWEHGIHGRFPLSSGRDPKATHGLELPQGLGILWVGSSGRSIDVALSALCLQAQKLFESQEDLQRSQKRLEQSYQAFDALTRVATDRDLLLKPRNAIVAVLEQATGIEAGLKAVCWLERADQVVPAEWHGLDEPRLRGIDLGLVGQSIASAELIVETDWPRSSLRCEEELELARAQRVVAAPLICGRGVLGCLVVWHESPGRFDAHFGKLIQALAAQAAIIVDHNHLHTQALHYAKLSEDLLIAAEIQKRLLLGSAPPPTAGLELATVSKPSREVGGDFYDFLPHAGGTVDILIGDVMGKGLPAAMVAAAIKSRFLRSAAAGRDELNDAPASVEDIAARVHEAVFEELVDIERFVTAIYARFDVRGRTLRFVDCGHTPILHHSKASGRSVSLRREWDHLANLPFGMHRECEYRASDVQIESGDVLLFFTDGLTEAADEAGRLYGEETLGNRLSALAECDADEIALSLQDEVIRFSRSQGIADDMTCIVLKFEGVPEEGDLRELQYFADGYTSLEAFDTTLVGTPDGWDDLRRIVGRAASPPPAESPGEEEERP